MKSVAWLNVFEGFTIASRHVCYRVKHILIIINLFFVLHQGPKGEVGISGEQGIPGPSVC